MRPPHSTRIRRQSRPLLKAGADPNARLKKWLSTPLHEARGTQHGTRQAIVALLQPWANLEAQDDDGETPLHFTDKRNKNPAAIEALQSSAGKPNPTRGIS